jgi:hypothetical protein
VGNETGDEENENGGGIFEANDEEGGECVWANENESVNANANVSRTANAGASENINRSVLVTS